MRRYDIDTYYSPSTACFWGMGGGGKARVSDSKSPRRAVQLPCLTRILLSVSRPKQPRLDCWLWTVRNEVSTAASLCVRCVRSAVIFRSGNWRPMVLQRPKAARRAADPPDPQPSNPRAGPRARSRRRTRPPRRDIIIEYLTTPAVQM